MNQEVEEVITKDSEPAETVVQGKTEIRQGPTQIAVAHPLKGLANVRPAERADPDIVVIDDTDIGGGGKGKLLLPVLEADGYDILVSGRQSIALKL